MTVHVNPQVLLKSPLGWTVRRAVLVLILAAALAAVVAAAYFTLYDTGQSSHVTKTVVIDKKQGAVISGMSITTTQGPCLIIRDSHNITVQGMDIGSCGGNAIEVHNSSNVKIVDNYIHPERAGNGCNPCDIGDGVFAVRSNHLLIQGNVIAYGESNVELLGVQDTQVIGNFLLNPLGPFPRGLHVQVWSFNETRSARVWVEYNYALSSKDPAYKLPDAQTDGFNAGYTDDIVMRGNYLRGGRFHAGCAYILDAGNNNGQVLNNIGIDFGNCGVGVTGGTNHVVEGNQLFSHGLNQPNVGNVALYVWRLYQSVPCSTIRVTNNIAVVIRSDGSTNSYWDGGGCANIALGGNVFDAAAINMLQAVDVTPPPPPIPPFVYERRPASPYSTAE